jgi:hypothetical protein
MAQLSKVRRLTDGMQRTAPAISLAVPRMHLQSTTSSSSSTSL